MTLQSSLSEERLYYKPKFPDVLHNILSLVANGGEKIAIKAEIKEKFPLQSFDKISLFKAHTSSEKKMKIGIVLSGGPAAGGHNVISAVYDALQHFHPSNTLIGFLNGPSGIVENKFIELNQAKIAPFRNQGGFDLIGTGRTKIETEEQFEKSRLTVESHQLDGLIIVGGDDSNTNAAFLAEYFLKKQCKTIVVGVPKTIDGDLKNRFVEASFGFDSASKTYSELVGNVLKDALSQKKYTFFIKVMGRTASHLVLECALKTHPNFILVSEEIAFQKKKLSTLVSEIADLIEERSKRGKEYGVILIPEGVIEFLENVSSDLPPEIQEQFHLERDPHGNLPVSKIDSEKMFITLVERELKQRDFKGKFSPQPLFFGYEGRSCLPSNFDCNYCYSLGLTATLLVANNLTGRMAVLKNLADIPEAWEPMGVPLVAMLALHNKNGKEKAVIEKGLVDLKGAPYQYYLKHKETWKFDDTYVSPGPIQFFGHDEFTNTITDTLLLESKH